MGFSLALTLLVVAALVAAFGGDPAGTIPEEPPSPPTLQPRATREATPLPDAGSPSTAAADVAATSAPEPLLRVTGGNRLMGKPIVEPENAGGTLVIGVEAGPTSLNPIVAGDLAADSILHAIFEPLVAPHPDTLRPVGVLAESWEVDAHGLVWTFHLRDGVRWQDAEPFSAGDVAFTYNLYLDPSSGHPAAGRLGDVVRSVEAIGDLDVRVVTSVRYPDLPLALGSLPVVARHIFGDVPLDQLRRHSASTGEEPALVAGTGPFRFERFDENGAVVTVANDAYWDGPPSLDRLVARPVEGQAAMIQSLRAGDIDVGTLAPGAAPAFEGLPIDLVDVPMLGFTMLGFNLNTQRTVLFEDARVRQAMLLALDRGSMIADARAGYGDIAHGTFPPHAWAASAGVPATLYGYDPGRARELLDQAGWTTGPNGVRERQGRSLSFTVITNAENEIRARYVELMREQWAAVGIDARVEIVSFDDMVTRLTGTGDFEAFLTGFSWDVTPDQSALWACSGGRPASNMTGYCNPSVDRLLVRAEREFDPERRAALYLEMQDLVLTDLPVAILDFPRAIAGVAQRVHNLYPSAVNLYFNARTWWVE